MITSTVIRWRCVAILTFALVNHATGTIFNEIQRVNDLQQWARISSEEVMLKTMQESDNSDFTVFAPVDDVFNRFPRLRSMRSDWGLSHFAKARITEFQSTTKWKNTTLITRPSQGGGDMYLVQAEHNPGNFSYFANNGRLCNHVSASWQINSGNEILYKICSPFGEQNFGGTALKLIQASPQMFRDLSYSNNDLSRLNGLLTYFPTIATVVFGDSAWTAKHTYFLPNNLAVERVPSIHDKRFISRQVFLAHVTMPGVVLFTEAWLYDYGIHQYNSARLVGNTLVENNKLRLSIRNITNRDTGRWTLYVKSMVYERYSGFERGAVWAKIVKPNIPVTNGVVHIVDQMLGVVTQTMEQMLYSDDRFVRLTDALNRIGSLIKSQLAANQGSFTFFAPTNEAFMRIPQDIRDRLFSNSYWLYRVLKMHIIPGTRLTTDQIRNTTLANTEDNQQRLYFIVGEWPKGNITYYVIGGGTHASIRQEDVAATNGVMQYIDRVLGVPYHTMYQLAKNETRAKISWSGIENTNLRYALNPYKVVRQDQNFTFFLPTDQAWEKVPLSLRQKFWDGGHWRALQFVFKRHILQGQALMLQDLRLKTYIMMNNQKVQIQQVGRFWQLYWPYGRMTARLIEGGEMSAINGYIHLIDQVFVLEEDLDASGAQHLANCLLVIMSVVMAVFMDRFEL